MYDLQLCYLPNLIISGISFFYLLIFEKVILTLKNVILMIFIKSTV